MYGETLEGGDREGRGEVAIIMVIFPRNFCQLSMISQHVITLYLFANYVD
jgi:hypothetical protein